MITPYANSVILSPVPAVVKTNPAFEEINIPGTQKLPWGSRPQGEPRMGCTKVAQENPAGFSLSYRIFKLAVIQLGIETALLQQGLVGSAFHNVSILQHQDQIRIANGAQPVRDYKGCSVL